MKVFFYMAALVAALGCSKRETPLVNESAATEAASTATPVNKQTLAEFTREMMDFDKCQGSKSTAHSNARKNTLSGQISRILEELGGGREAQEIYVLMMCIESRYRTDAKSHAGALGIAQVMPATGQLVATQLGWGDLSRDDLLDPEINIRLGYTYFLGLVEKFDGNFAKAAAGYNSGPASSSVKAMGYLGQGHVETGWYVGNLYNLKEELRLLASSK